MTNSNKEPQQIQHRLAGIRELLGSIAVETTDPELEDWCIETSAETYQWGDEQ